MQAYHDLFLPWPSAVFCSVLHLLGGGNALDEVSGMCLVIFKIFFIQYL